MEKCIFLDKDGTLIVDVPFNIDIDLIECYEDVLSPLRSLQEIGYKLVIISNQSGIARNMFTEIELDRAMTHLINDFRTYGIDILDYFYCPHDGYHTPACSCRKPAPGMLQRAADLYNIDLASSWMIGDIWSDIQAGIAAGCHSILIDRNKTERLRPKPEMVNMQNIVVCDDFAHVAEFIINHYSQSHGNTYPTLLPYLDKFKDKHILVIGDCILDIYLDTQCDRLAPEASIPVLDIKNKRYCLGGAANVALNLRKLGAQVSFLTLLGQDEHAKKTIELLQHHDIGTAYIHFVEDSPTLSKTRILKDHQILYRVDEGKELKLPEDQEGVFLKIINGLYDKCDAIYIADYNKGCIGYKLIDSLANLQNYKPRTIAIDSKNYEQFKNLHPTIIKPNYKEALQLLQERPEINRLKQVVTWPARIFDKTNAQTVALTLDKDGGYIFHKSGDSYRYACGTTNTTNVSGAGDTFLSVFLLTQLIGMIDRDACTVSSKATDIAIQKDDTALCTIEELRMEMMHTNDKVIDDLEYLRYLCTHLKQQHTIVFTNGCFDIFHSGHVHYLSQAKASGDILIVGVNTDESVKRLKGSKRPINNLSDRMEVLRSLSCVDYIIPFGSKKDDSPIHLINTIHPDIFVKGEDYKDKFTSEKKVLERSGIAQLFIPLIPHQSTSKIISRAQENNISFLKKQADESLAKGQKYLISEIGQYGGCYHEQ